MPRIIRYDSKKTFTPNLDPPPKTVTLRMQVLITLLLSPRSIKKTITTTFAKTSASAYYY